MMNSEARNPDSDRLAELEIKNTHLQQLVAELLIKNHQLRELQGCSTAAIADAPARPSGVFLQRASRVSE
ncbi:MAG TPA: hypothetical protein VHX63_11500 [Acidobacteriaceae bacterium]|jgi:hypothetical protein|nr:hypothetical protein [Acidobacteriaceae bacterium]